MKPVQSKPRFRCDFCRFQATEPTVIKHERICWRNPERHCPTCNNTGVIAWVEDIYPYNEPCPYCARFNPQIPA
jgi:hypothetical protein